MENKGSLLIENVGKKVVFFLDENGEIYANPTEIQKFLPVGSYPMRIIAEIKQVQVFPQ